MAGELIIAVDGMGGDGGPSIVVHGMSIARTRSPDVSFLIFGDETVIAPEISKYANLSTGCTLVHTDVAVAMDDKPSQALRRGRRTSSMWMAIAAVKEGTAQAAISAGNTGALMAMAKVILKTMSDIERPAIAAIWPTLRGESIVLDVGATIGVDTKQLVDFAVMGEAMSRTIFGLKRPTVGLLNIGVEEVKGLDEVKNAGRLLKESNLPFEYYGFVEGDDIGQGTVDVVVTEGFSGNIALKTAEGTAKQISAYLRAALARTLFARIGYLFARSAFNVLREKLDPRTMNGGVFLGLNGIVIKSHGGTDEIGYASAIDLAAEMIRNDLVARIERDLGKFNAGDASEPSLETKVSAS
jgi:glycerol-3-phosphate acyltransferase PlsX